MLLQLTVSICQLNQVLKHQHIYIAWCVLMNEVSWFEIPVHAQYQLVLKQSWQQAPLTACGHCAASCCDTRMTENQHALHTILRWAVCPWLNVVRNWWQCLNECVPSVQVRARRMHAANKFINQDWICSWLRWSGVPALWHPTLGCVCCLLSHGNIDKTIGPIHCVS